MPVFVIRDTARGEIVARLRNEPAGTRQRTRDGTRDETRTPCGRFDVELADGRVVAVAVVDDGSWPSTLLADLIAQQLAVHRDEAIQAVLEVGLTRS
jgi:hypothetical protein